MTQTIRQRRALLDIGKPARRTGFDVDVLIGWMGIVGSVALVVLAWAGVFE